MMKDATRRRIVFIHLDWGIGGAESLMLQLALASSSQKHDVQLVTTRCDPEHCFAALKPPDGILVPFLHVWGSWIPSHLGGRCQAMMSTLRLLYAALCVGMQPEHADVIVLDVLPTPLWLLRWLTPRSGLLFYCHFPDQLLVREKTVEEDEKEEKKDRLSGIYRFVLNSLEEHTMHLADTITVNSNFTQSVVRETFPSLKGNPLPVLYPALDASAAIQHEATKKNPRLVVSLNRYERKKNLELFLRAAALLQHETTIVIAGGYDVRNVENVEYRAELGSLATELGVRVDFRLSISDTERQDLLTTAAAVVYTPEREHFGIVPIEAMAAGTAVVCCDSGGPTETVKDGVTGFLCAPLPFAFAAALDRILEDPKRQISMGAAGRAHVQETFGTERLAREWEDMVQATAEKGFSRRRGMWRTPVYCLIATATCLIVCWILTLWLRRMGVLEDHHSILGGARRFLSGGKDEL